VLPMDMYGSAKLSFMHTIQHDACIKYMLFCDVFVGSFGIGNLKYLLRFINSLFNDELFN
jgi:hypothetical protein